MPFVVEIVAVSMIGILLWKTIYNLVFHPLRDVPGPRFARASRLWYLIKLFRGEFPTKLKEIHDIYGPVVRIAPGELSYNNAEAWQDIYATNLQPTSDGSEKPTIIGLDPFLYGNVFSYSNSLIDTQGAEYSEHQHPISYALSTKALLINERTFTLYFDRCVQSLKEHCTTSEILQIVPWIENTILDLASRLIIGQDFNAISCCPTSHSICRQLQGAISFALAYLQCRRLPRIFTLLLESIPSFVAWNMFKNLGSIGPAVKNRIKKNQGEKDVVSYFSESQHADTSFFNVSILLVGAVGTLSTAVVASLYFLLCNRDALDSVRRELRSHYFKREEITPSSAQRLVYLRACINESLRLAPPIMGTTLRRVSRDGANICGQFIPPDTTVGVNHYATYHSERNFKRAEDFCPERWLALSEDSEFANDKQEAFQSNGFGPRKCIAKNFSTLAFAALVAHILWEFDISIDERSRNWLRFPGLQYMVMVKQPLYVKMWTKKD